MKHSALDADIQAFLTYLARERGRSANTISTYKFRLNSFREWLNLRKPGRGRKLGAEARTRAQLDLSKDDLMSFLGFLDGKKMKPASVALTIHALKSFSAFLRLEGKILERSAKAVEELSTPLQPERLPNVLSVDAVNRLLDAAEPGSYLYARDKAILALLFSTGCRVSELCGLQMWDLHLHEGLVRCLGKGGKERVLFLGSKALDALRVYLQSLRPFLLAGREDSTFLFLSKSAFPLTRQLIWRMVRSCARRADLSGEVTPHTLRHSAASAMVAAGASLVAVQEYLGHSKISTTQRYVHLDSNHLRQVHHCHHPLNRPRPRGEERGES